jgi:hypothetical protein
VLAYEAYRLGRELSQLDLRATSIETRAQVFLPAASLARVRPLADVVISLPHGSRAMSFTSDLPDLTRIGLGATIVEGERQQAGRHFRVSNCRNRPHADGRAPTPGPVSLIDPVIGAGDRQLSGSQIARFAAPH